MKERTRLINFATFKEMTEYMKRNNIKQEDVFGSGWSHEHKHFFEYLREVQ